MVILLRFVYTWKGQLTKYNESQKMAVRVPLIRECPEVGIRPLAVRCAKALLVPGVRLFENAAPPT